MNCKDCKHIGDEVTLIDDDTCESFGTGFFECTAMYIEGGAMADNETLMNECKDRDSVVVSSGSGNESFLVKHGFYCKSFRNP